MRSLFAKEWESFRNEKKKCFLSQERFSLSKRKKLLLKSAGDTFAGHRGGEKKGCCPCLQGAEDKKQSMHTGSLQQKPGHGISSSLDWGLQHNGQAALGTPWGGRSRGRSPGKAWVEEPAGLELGFRRKPFIGGWDGSILKPFLLWFPSKNMYFISPCSTHIQKHLTLLNRMYLVFSVFLYFFFF